MESSVPPELLTRAFHRDLKLFSRSADLQRALLFPSLNSFSRFCLHSLVKDSYPDLTTFSVGAEKERRPVVCHQATVADQALRNVCQPTPKEKSPLRVPQTLSKENRNEDKTDKVISGGENEAKIDKSSTGKSRTQRRPDRAVYAPPGSHRRSVQGSVAKPNPITEAVTEPVATRPTPSSNIPKCIFSKSISPISTSPIPNIRNEIEEILGPVRLVTPHNDYLALESGCVTSSDVVDDDLPNVVELYDFPEEYKTDHLEDCLHRNLTLVHYYDLKWVDSTHALAIFSEASVAQKALNIADSFIKFRPFWAASSQSLAHARVLNLTETTRFKARPDTSTATAKRLLARALGMPSLAADKTKNGGQ